MQFTITAKGHHNVTGTHKTTIEITKENFLTPEGHCIIGIGADCSLGDIPEEMKRRLREGKEVRILLESGGIREEVHARGGDKLTFTDPHAIIIRKSEWQDGRTMAVCADKASSDLDRRLIRELRKGKELRVILEI